MPANPTPAETLRAQLIATIYASTGFVAGARDVDAAQIADDLIAARLTALADAPEAPEGNDVYDDINEAGVEAQMAVELLHGTELSRWNADQRDLGALAGDLEVLLSLGSRLSDIYAQAPMWDRVTYEQRRDIRLAGELVTKFCHMLCNPTDRAPVPAAGTPWRESKKVGAMVGEMAAQASLGHKKYCVGVHPATADGPEDAEWHDWRDALDALCDAVERNALFGRTP